MDHHPDKRPPQRSRASLIVLIMLAFLLLIATGILVASLPDDPAWQQETTATSLPSPDDSGFACTPAEAQQLMPFGSGVMKVTSSRLAFLDIRGSEQYFADVDFTAPFCMSSGDYFLVADREGHSLVLSDLNGERFRATVDGRISGAAIRSDGYLAIIQDQSESTGVVSIFSPDSGRKLFDCVFAESGYALSVSFPTGSDSFDVTLLNTASSSARPVIKRFSLDGRQLGERRPDLNGIYPLTVYAADEQLVLCSAASLVAFSYTSDSLAWQQNYHQITAVQSSADGLVVLATDEQDGQCSLYLLQPGGQSKFKLKIGESLDNLDIRGSMASLSYGTRVIVTSLSSGRIILDQDVAAEVIRVAFASDGSLTVVTRSGVLRLAPPSDQ